MTADDRYRYIRSVMVRKGVKNVDIARQEDVSREYVFFVMKGVRVGHRIRKAIADACGVPVSELWPDDDDSELPAAA